jgi:SAM-dependent methyltransferase
MMSFLDISKIYACPVCKSNLYVNNEHIMCRKCGNRYSIRNGIPRFVPPEYWIKKENSSILKKAYSRFFDILAPIYESPLWYQLTLNLSGAKGNSIDSITDFIRNVLSGVNGNILDVACGPSTYGRRIASETKRVYGIDLSYGMLKQGLKFLSKDKNKNVFLAQATADLLPFPSETFDGCICAGSLHLFNDPLVVLSEISKTMKSSIPLALQTFTRNKTGTNPSIKEKTGFHFFDAQELEELLVIAGFQNVLIKEIGTVLYASSNHK